MFNEPRVPTFNRHKSLPWQNWKFNQNKKIVLLCTIMRHLRIEINVYENALWTSVPTFNQHNFYLTDTKLKVKKLRLCKFETATNCVRYIIFSSFKCYSRGFFTFDFVTAKNHPQLNVEYPKFIGCNPNFYLHSYLASL